MKHFTSSLTAAAIFLCGISACGNNNSKTNNSDSTLTKIDTTLDPADHTNAVVSDSTQPQGAVGLDTVAGGKSTSSGRKDTTKHK
jgi:hypothetical protein